jgi:uncharacterized protein YbbC (DUF1343 family)
MSIPILIAFFCKPTCGRYVMIGCFCLAMTTSIRQTQKNPITPVHTTGKIALLDHSRVRKEYKALRLVADSVKHEWDLLKNKENHIKQDSMDDAKRQALLDVCENEKKQFLQKRGARIQQYESKIIEAISKVVAEGGFTDVQPIYKDKPVPGGTDITDKVLNKLN